MIVAVFIALCGCGHKVWDANVHSIIKKKKKSKNNLKLPSVLWCHKGHWYFTNTCPRLVTTPPWQLLALPSMTSYLFFPFIFPEGTRNRKFILFQIIWLSEAAPLQIRVKKCVFIKELEKKELLKSLGRCHWINKILFFSCRAQELKNSKTTAVPTFV